MVYGYCEISRVVEDHLTNKEKEFEEEEEDEYDIEEDFEEK